MYMFDLDQRTNRLIIDRFYGLYGNCSANLIPNCLVGMGLYVLEMGPLIFSKGEFTVILQDLSGL